MAKTEKFEARISPEDDELLRWAADSTGVSLSAFVLGAAIREARELHRSEHVTVLPARFADEFFAWLDRPADPPEEMKRLRDAPELRSD